MGRVSTCQKIAKQYTCAVRRSMTTMRAIANQGVTWGGILIYHGLETNTRFYLHSQVTWEGYHVMFSPIRYYRFRTWPGVIDKNSLSIQISEFTNCQDINYGI